MIMLVQMHAVFVNVLEIVPGPIMLGVAYANCMSRKFLPTRHISDAIKLLTKRVFPEDVL
jgi:hypothetical protein